MRLHGPCKGEKAVVFQGGHNGLVLGDRLLQMGQLFLQLEAVVHSPDGLQQGKQHVVVQGAEQRQVKVLVLLNKEDAPGPVVAHGVGQASQGPDVLLGHRVEGLPHVRQLQHLAHAEHFPDGMLFLRTHLKKQHVLQNEIQIERLHLRALSGAGSHHAHQLHALDSFPQHIATNAQRLA